VHVCAFTTEFSTEAEGVTLGSLGFAFAVGEFSMLGAAELGGSVVSVGAEQQLATNSSANAAEISANRDGWPRPTWFCIG
jgi:hypothetical protein